MTHNDEPSRLESLREELVAYLDGELAPDETARIEEQISRDPSLRRELDSLAKTWDWLDALERPTVDEEFTRTTIEMVAASAVQEVERIRQEAPRRAALEWAFGGLAAALLVLVGFLTASAIWTNPNQWLLENYSLIQNHDFYRRGESLAYLELLHRSGVFDASGGFEDEVSQSPASTTLNAVDSQGGASPGPTPPLSPAPPSAEAASPPASPGKPSALTPAQSPSLVPPRTPAEARQEILAMSSQEREDLEQKLLRFTRLTSAEQDRLRAFHQMLWQRPDAQALARTLALYCRWYTMLMPHQRLELETLAEENRIAWIRERQQELLTEAMRNALFNLPPERLRNILSSTKPLGANEQLPREDWGALFKFFENLAAGRARQMLEGGVWPPARRQEILRNLSRFQDENRKREYLAMLWLQNQLNHFDTAPPITAEDVAALSQELSPETRRRLESLPPDARVQLVWTWAKAGIIFRYIGPRVMWDFRRPMSEQELSKFVEEQLSKQDRERLLSLPPEDMRREVIRLYLRQNFPGMGRWERIRGRGEAGERPRNQPPDPGPPGGPALPPPQEDRP